MIKHRKFKDIILKIVAGIVVFMMFIPIFVMLPSIFKGKREILTVPWSFFAKEATMDNIRWLGFLQSTSIGVNYFNALLMSMLVAVTAVVLSLTINMIAAYAFARLKFPCKKIVWTLVLATMFIPGITILITSVKVVHELGLTNTFMGLVIPGLVSAYNLFFFRQFFLGFPVDLDEAAKIDGASTWQIFTQIYLPMSKTPMVIIGASIFMGYYNSYIWPNMIITEPKSKLTQIMQVISILNADATYGYGVVVAAAFVAMVPPLIIFVVVQRYIRDGIQLTGVK